jgi:hypothetical protein
MNKCLKNLIKFAASQADKKKTIPHFAFAKDISTELPR